MRLLMKSWIVCLLLGMAGAASGQVIGEGIQGNGSAQIKRAPDLLRVEVELRSEGKDLKDALAKFKARREALKAQLIKLGAQEASIDLGLGRPVEASNDRAATVQRMIRERMSGKGATPPAPVAVSVSATIKADWPLPASDADALLVAAAELQSKIREAKLFEPPARAKTEEEEEKEGAESNRGDGSLPGPKPGEPVFTFIARIPPEEMAKATAEAIQKARESAARLAKAGGVELGAVRTLSCGVSTDTSDSSSGGGLFPGQGYAGGRASQRSENPLEIYGGQATPLIQQVTVWAAFGVK